MTTTWRGRRYLCLASTETCALPPVLLDSEYDGPDNWPTNSSSSNASFCNFIFSVKFHIIWHCMYRASRPIIWTNQQDVLFMYLLYNLCTTLHDSNDYLLPTLRVVTGSNRQAELFQYGLCRAAEYSKSWTADDERNGPSKHVELYKDCRINTYRKCILLVCLYSSSHYSNFLIGQNALPETIIAIFTFLCGKPSFD
jgi:hypothetical protein